MNKIARIVSMCLFLLACEASGQKVSSDSYDLMLNNLLSHTVPEIGVKDVKADEGTLFLDAREWAEFDVSHIEGAIWVGYDDFEISRVGEVDKNQKIIVYCSVGYRSEKISEKLLEAGYQDVSNLYGGIFEWKNQDQTVVNQRGRTEKVHAFDRIWGVWLRKGEKVY